MSWSWPIASLTCSCWTSTSPPCWHGWMPARTTTGAASGTLASTYAAFCPGYQARRRAFGAIPIDARQPLDHVADAILSHTLASPATSQASKPGNQPGARSQEPSRI